MPGSGRRRLRGGGAPISRGTSGYEPGKRFSDKNIYHQYCGSVPHRCGGGAGVPGGLESSDGAFSEGGNLRGVYHVLFLRTGKPRFDDERRFRHSTHVHGGEPGIGNSGGVHRSAHVRRLRVKNRKKSENNIPSLMGMRYNDNNL